LCHFCSRMGACLVMPFTYPLAFILAPSTGGRMSAGRHRTNRNRRLGPQVRGERRLSPRQAIQQAAAGVGAVAPPSPPVPGVGAFDDHPAHADPARLGCTLYPARAGGGPAPHNLNAYQRQRRDARIAGTGSVRGRRSAIPCARPQRGNPAIDRAASLAPTPGRIHRNRRSPFRPISSIPAVLAVPTSFAVCSCSPPCLELPGP
jgi:hypothetical protein